MILGGVVSVCSVGQDTLEKGVGCEGIEVADVEKQAEN